MIRSVAEHERDPRGVLVKTSAATAIPKVRKKAMSSPARIAAAMMTVSTNAAINDPAAMPSSTASMPTSTPEQNRRRRDAIADVGG